MSTRRHHNPRILLAAATVFMACGGDNCGPIKRELYQDELVEADYWDDELYIMSAGLGFDGIVGVPDLDYETVRAAGAAWIGEPDCETAPENPLTSAASARTITNTSRGTAEYADGLPVVMSWPVLGSTLHPEDFLFTLNDGSTAVPTAATLVPNWELNERNVLVVFGEFGNRKAAGEPGRLFPTKVEIVDDGTPLMFVGPGGVVKSGVGLTWETEKSGYDAGPVLVGAKLNRVGEAAKGEGGSSVLEEIMLPNDEFAHYPEARGGDFRLRMLTTGGFSPDGVRAVLPTDYETFFRLHAAGVDGEDVVLTEVGKDYAVKGGTLKILGLSETGPPEGGDVHYDDCYIEDRDNYIDIILVGDEDAARSLRSLEIPATGEYKPFYNPGGPGKEPFEGVRYTEPGPPHVQPIIHALDDPMRVSYP